MGIHVESLWKHKTPQSIHKTSLTSHWQNYPYNYNKHEHPTLLSHLIQNYHLHTNKTIINNHCKCCIYPLTNVMRRLDHKHSHMDVFADSQIPAHNRSGHKKSAPTNTLTSAHTTTSFRLHTRNHPIKPRISPTNHTRSGPITLNTSYTHLVHYHSIHLPQIIAQKSTPLSMVRLVASKWTTQPSTISI